MEYVKNGISGQKRYVVKNNKVFDAKTGRHIYTVENGVLRSAITGAIIANGSAFVSSGESIDLSFVTATEDKILTGYVGADKDGGQVHGSMPISQVTETDNKVTVSKGYLDETKEFTVVVGGGSGGTSAAYYKCASVDMNNMMWTGYLYDKTTKTFSETLTEGLSYNGFPMPTIGHIYTEDASLELIIKTALSAYWSQLSADIQAGKYTTANLGDIIEVDNTALADVGLAAGKLQFEIVAIDNADLVEERAHSITVMATKVLFNSAMGGWDWGDTTIRAYLQDSFIKCLDPSCAALIAKVNRTLYKRGGGSTTVQDTVFLPSYTEMGGGDNEGVTEGVQFDRMTSDQYRIRPGAEHYFLSSVSTESVSTAAYRTVHQTGVFDWYYNSHGIVPAFVLV